VGYRVNALSDRVAVRIGSQVPFLMVEARQKVDQFDANINSEGVIVYQIQTSDPLGYAQNNTAPVKLLTETALKPGQKFTSTSGVTVQVKSAIPGGFTVHIERPADPRCPDIHHFSHLDSLGVLLFSVVGVKALRG